MKSIEFKKDSWHYWFVNKSTDYFTNLTWKEQKPEICGYTRAFIGGVIKTLLLSLVLLGLTIPSLAALVFFIGYFFGMHSNKLIGIGIIELIVAGGLVLSILMGNTISWFRDQRRLKQSPPGALKTMYTNWKEKTCAYIDFK